MTAPPKILLQIAGASLHASPLKSSALILIDHQMEYVTGALPLAGIGAAIAEMGRLLATARRHQVPVFHVVHHGRRGGPLFDPDGSQIAIIPEVSPDPNEPVIVKSLPNAFAGTPLQEHVRDSGRTELIIAGFATHMCVSATARAALDHGYRTTIVAAAVATRDLPDPLGGGVIAADSLHRAALAALADRFAIIVADSTALQASLC